MCTFPNGRKYIGKHNKNNITKRKAAHIIS